MLNVVVSKAKKVASKLGVFIGLIILMIVFSFLTPNFLKANNLLTVTMQIAVYGILASGVAYVLIIGGAELSAGSTLGLTGMCFVVALRWGWNPMFAIIFAIVCGAFCGLINGFMVTKMHMIPFIATLGTQYVFRGFTNILTEGTSVAVRSLVSEEWVERLSFLGGGKLFGWLPILSIFMLIFAILHQFILCKTSFGRKVYAVGSNAEAARLSGINKDMVVMLAYTISGIMASVAGVLLTCRLMSAQPTAGQSYELEAIAAGVIGGVSMMGGQGTTFGAILGAFIIGIMRNGLNLIGVNTCLLYTSDAADE